MSERPSYVDPTTGERVVLTNDCRVCGAPTVPWGRYCSGDCLDEAMHNQGKYGSMSEEAAKVISPIARYLESLDEARTVTEPAPNESEEPK